MSDRPVYEPPPLPESLAERYLRHDERFDTAETLAVERQEQATFPARPQLVSSAHGPLRHLLLWYASSAPGTYGFRSIYTDLLQSLPPATRVTMLAHPTVADEAAALLDETREEGTFILVRAPDWLSFSVWAEDAFVVVEDVGSDPSVTYIVEPESFPRHGDQYVAELVAQPAAAELAQLPITFQGGNILIGDDFVLIGRDYLDESVQRLSELNAVQDFPYRGSLEEQEDYTRLFFRRNLDPARTFHFLDSLPRERPGRTLTVIDGQPWLNDPCAGRGRKQPIFHIDMFISLAGRNPKTNAYRLLVGDPGRANELLGWSPVEHELQHEFDAIAVQLEELGFEVTRTPMPYMPARENEVVPLQLRDGSVVWAGGRITWYHATSNNCLVSINGDQREVWLPTYGHAPNEGLRATDDEHRRVWEELGFSVHQLGNFHPFAVRQGALHCIKKYLAR